MAYWFFVRPLILSYKTSIHTLVTAGLNLSRAQRKPTQHLLWTLLSTGWTFSLMLLAILKNVLTLVFAVNSEFEFRKTHTHQFTISESLKITVLCKSKNNLHSLNNQYLTAKFKCTQAQWMALCM